MELASQTIFFAKHYCKEETLARRHIIFILTIRVSQLYSTYIGMDWISWGEHTLKEGRMLHSTHRYLDYWPIKKGNGNKYNLLFLNGIYLVHFYKRHLQYKINPVYWTNDEQQQLSFYLYGNLSFRSSWLLLVYYLNKMY